MADSVVYLNNAATAWPKAPGVAESVRDALWAFPDDPSRSVSFIDDPVAECRTRLARLLRVETPDRIVLTVNATQAINLALLGLGKERIRRVVTTVTEHNSVLRPLHHLSSRWDFEWKAVPLNARGDVDMEAFEQALRARPSLVILNHASNVTGRICDVVRLFALAKAAGAITLLDASQSFGRIPVLPEACSADVVAFTGHKGLRGPEGTGGLYVAPGLELEQVMVGGTGIRSESLDHPAEMPLRLEAGTRNLPALAGWAVALRWMEEHGDDYRDHERHMGALLESRLRAVPGVQLIGVGAGERLPGLISARLDRWKVEEAAYALWKSFGVLGRAGLHCAPLIHAALGSAPEGTLRFSSSGFTTEEEIDRVGKAMAAMTS